MTENATKKNISFCAENRRLTEEFGQAVQELILLHEQQFIAVVEGDHESTRFDLLIHMANEKKREAKYALMRHMEEHGC
jgi:tRNA splicing endonuclease